MSSFTHHLYRNTLIEYLSQGYNITDFSKTIDGKQLILRHDIDMDLDLAEPISEIESSVGATSIYFVRLHAKNYNALSLSSVRIMKKIAARGQEIGLHYEPTFTKNEDHELQLLIYLFDTLVFMNPPEAVLICQKFFLISIDLMVHLSMIILSIFLTVALAGEKVVSLGTLINGKS